ncbi:MAG: formylglycine-generating enzyme family protein [Candidatus Lernaella stagnicola]|nr:formylglycine-generating enzyme family protein [Candidatus Lernaella stagnicola]
MTINRLSILLCVLLAALFLVTATFSLAGVEPDSTPTPVKKKAYNPDGMVHIPGGWFKMGCSPGDGECFDREKPSKRVYVDAFFIDIHEVTQAEYQRVMGANPSRFSGCTTCPVETVNWNDARSYCGKVGKRLPTEAEWEYAARGGTTGARYGEIDAIAWYRGNSGKKTHPVGQRQPNAYGLYDMLGNVWEWCEDWFDKDWYSKMPERNPRNDNQSPYRVLRGGSWGSNPRSVRASFRIRIQPSITFYFNGGFRCVGTEK